MKITEKIYFAYLHINEAVMKKFCNSWVILQMHNNKDKQRGL